ncbi:phage tail assembly protein [Amycolatopsis anabasis]|uniref:phage tail assembly protein n=1 Tax=Amycolatopsis anabasis TaxID=1840409 RepID=UPI00131A9B93|nr:phage tail assembly protein [Amycolatopsis anabasis]
MTNSFSLDDLREDLDREFAPCTLTLGGEEIVLRNLMRLPEKERTEVLGALKEVEALDIESEEAQTEEDLNKMSAALDRVLGTVAAEGKGKKLVQAIGGDVLLGMKVLERWTEATQPGEAQNSPA